MIDDPFFFILGEDHEVIPTDDIRWWLAWMEQRDPHVALTRVIVDGDTYVVSTVFLGMDKGYRKEDQEDYKPVLFETMIYLEVDGEQDKWLDFQGRSCTWESAVQGHAIAVELMHKDLPKDLSHSH
jgi:hypothetical protein